MHEQSLPEIYLLRDSCGWGITAVIGLNTANFARFQIVGAAVPFAYPWRLVQPKAITELTA
jgi:hypothetical protein